MRFAHLSALCALAGILANCANEQQTSTEPPGITASGTGITAVTNWYVKPNGLTSNSGTSTGSPWPLSYALNGGAGGQIQPGDTVWMLGGTYGPDSNYKAQSINGNVNDRIVFKQYPGQRATIDGRLQVFGSYLTFWGFEVMQSNPMSHTDWYGIESYEGSVGARFIRLVIHDANASGLILYWPNGDASVHGCILYNNGTNGRHHGMYVQGNIGGKYVRTNVVFDNASYGIHAYSDAVKGQPPLANINVINNMSFNNGSISNSGNGNKSNILIGSTVSGSTLALATSNVTYYTNTSVGVGLTLGLDNVAGGDVIAEYNTMLGGRVGLQVYPWNNASTVHYDTTVAGTRAVEFFDASPSNYTWNSNVYYRSPSDLAWKPNSQSGGSWVDLPTFLSLTGFGNQTPQDQANTTPYGLRRWFKDISYVSNERFLAVYNPDGTSPVTVTLGSGWLVSGNHYDLYNVYQDMWGPPIASGTYNGSSISVPMTAISPPAPIQASSRGLNTGPTTGPTWNVFLIRKS
jgi:hypothetical protein